VFCPPASALPNGMRSGSNVRPNRSSRPVDFSVPPRRSFRAAHTAPFSLAAEVGGGMSDNVVGITSAMIPGKAGYWSRAGHSKASKGQLVFYRLDVVALGSFPTVTRKKWIYPESVRVCRCHFSFLRSLIRPKLSEHSFLPTATSGSARGLCALEGNQRLRRDCKGVRLRSVWRRCNDQRH
jgi:hypothetical protein